MNTDQIIFIWFLILIMIAPIVYELYFSKISIHIRELRHINKYHKLFNEIVKNNWKLSDVMLYRDKISMKKYKYCQDEAELVIAFCNLYINSKIKLWKKKI